MYSHAELHLAYQIANAEIAKFPYPHIYVREAWPADFYRDLHRALPESREMVPIAEARPVTGYKERFVFPLGPDAVGRLPPAKRAFWEGFAAWLLGQRFGQLVLEKFSPIVKDRFKKETRKIDFYSEALLVEDHTGYSLGPHSDAPKKVVTMLFYLPVDESQAAYGTSIYVPNDQNFTCPGGPHYPFDKFGRVRTLPFLPNSLFAFVKTHNSFHGVEPVVCADRNRWLLLFDVYCRFIDQPGAPPPAAALQATPPAKFTF